jgi:Fe-S-cluster containining protein
MAEFTGMTAKAFEKKYVYRTSRQMRLRVPQEATCPFLEEGGCSIHPAKPTQCRIFPFWPELLESRREWKKAARYCPGIGKGPLIQIEKVKAQAAEMREGYPTMYD